MLLALTCRGLPPPLSRSAPLWEGGCAEDRYRVAKITATKSSTGTGGTCMVVGKRRRRPLGGWAFQYSFFACSVVRYSSMTVMARLGTARSMRVRASLLVVPLPSIRRLGEYFVTAAATSCSRFAVSMTRCMRMRMPPFSLRSSAAKPHLSRPGSRPSTMYDARVSGYACPLSSTALMAAPPRSCVRL